eukprot:TRINITY_DN38594_c0_g1_i1.p1 TRINITY_DN38594_c0_g1~~TRINITY_DN38594_c0_g1_i1.p1  ORF type:complete len:255 (-),score=19.11 TRINITY_DN38594_c0_g1_i1:61-825(-)
MISAHECIPSWHLNSSSVCPYGRVLPGEVSLPENPSVVDIICVIYGYTLIPVILLLLGAAVFGTKRIPGQDASKKKHGHWIWYLVFMIVVTAINELAIKNLWKHPRPGYTGRAINEYGKPVGSCAVTCGMPSSHSLLSVGLLTLLVLDTARYVKHDKETPSSWSEYTLLPRGAFSPGQFNVSYAIWLIMLGPVPVSRLVLFDHSAYQVLLGSALGFALALFWFSMMKKFVVPADDEGESDTNGSSDNEKLVDTW